MIVTALHVESALGFKAGSILTMGRSYNVLSLIVKSDGRVEYLVAGDLSRYPWWIPGEMFELKKPDIRRDWVFADLDGEFFFLRRSGVVALIGHGKICKNSAFFSGIIERKEASMIDYFNSFEEINGND